MRAPMYSPWTSSKYSRGPAAVLEAAAAVLVGVGGRLHDAVERDVVDDLDRAHAGTTRLTENGRALRVGEDGGAADGRVGGRGEHGAAELRRVLGGGVDVVDPEVDAPARRLARRADGDEVARHGLLRLAADEARAGGTA